MSRSVNKSVPICEVYLFFRENDLLTCKHIIYFVHCGINKNKTKQQQHKSIW